MKRTKIPRSFVAKEKLTRIVVYVTQETAAALERGRIKEGISSMSAFAGAILTRTVREEKP